MKPAENSNRTFKCPFTFIDDMPKYSELNGCSNDMNFQQLVIHLQNKHPDSRLLAWIVAATWEDVCSGHDPDCA